MNFPVEFVSSGIPEDFNFIPNHSCIVLDDSLLEGYSTSVCDLFCRQSHHRNLTVLFITQELFVNNPIARTISKNAKNLVIFKNPRSITTIQTLITQLEGKNSSSLTKIIQQTIEKPFGFILIDLNQSTEKFLKYRFDIFKNFSYSIIPVDFLTSCDENGTFNSLSTFFANTANLK